MVTLSIWSMIADGQLAGVRPGHPRETVRTCLGEPDDWLNGEPRESSRLWRYGNFEVHFDEDHVWMLFTDYLDSLDAGPGRALDPWILGAPAMPGHDAVLRSLEAAGIRCTTAVNAGGQRVITAEHGAELLFAHEDDDAEHGVPGEEPWFALQLTAPRVARAADDREPPP